jgi:hypothetical protein
MQRMTMGHRVKLMPAKFVKAFNIRNKNDAADARAIRMANYWRKRGVHVGRSGRPWATGFGQDGALACPAGLSFEWLLLSKDQSGRRSV